MGGYRSELEPCLSHDLALLGSQVILYSALIDKCFSDYFFCQIICSSFSLLPIIYLKFVFLFSTMSFLKVPRNTIRGLFVDNPVFYLYDCNYEILNNTAFALENMKDTTLDEWVPNVLTHAIRQMMFVSGETAEASVETTIMIEEIVHAQVVEMVSPCNPVEDDKQCSDQSSAA